MQAMEPEHTNGNPPTVVSFGGGVNSVAMLLRLVDEGRPPDLVVAADTGEEWAHTYRVFDHAAAWCRDRGIPFHAVQSEHGRLVDYYHDKRIIPTMRYRHCTDRFKIQPILRHLRERVLPGHAHVVELLGIASDEAHRAKASPKNPTWLSVEFPLVRWGMDRRACIRYIKAHGADWPPVAKSGCQGCPFQGPRQFGAFYRADPENFARWRAMEENGRRFPEFTLTNTGTSRPYPLRRIQEAIDTQADLSAWVELDEVLDSRSPGCTGAACFT